MRLSIRNPIDCDRLADFDLPISARRAESDPYVDPDVATIALEESPRGIGRAYLPLKRCDRYDRYDLRGSYATLTVAKRPPRVH